MIKMKQPNKTILQQVMSELGKKGVKARFKGKSKKEVSEIMSKVRKTK